MPWHGSAYAFADLSEVGIGARPLSLGRAYTALSSDGSGIFINPAGLSDYPKMKFISMTGRLIEDVNYFSVGIANSFRLGTIGIGYISASSPNIPLTTLTNTPTGAVISDPYDYTDYTSAIYYLAYSKKISQSLSLGASWKYLSQNFSVTSGTMAGALGTGMEADLGLKLHPRSWLSIGSVFKNLLPASMGGKFVWQKNSRAEGIPMSVNIGTFIKLFGPAGLGHFKNQNLSVLFEAQSFPKLSRPTLFKTGLEWWITRGLALRSGIDQEFRAASDGGTEIGSNLTFGVGLKAGGFNFDYAYHQYGEIQGNISHFFSLGYIGFDQDLRTALRISPRSNGSIIPTLKQKPLLRHFSDVSDIFWAKDAIEYIATLGIMEGFPDNTFKPDQPLTRAQIAVLLIKAKGFKVVSDEASVFYDLPTSHWATPYVNAAVKRNYISGYPDGSFDPGKALSASEGVTILARFAGLVIPKAVSRNPYVDVDKDAWAAPAIYAAQKAGLLEFIGDQEFHPEDPLTRAEAAEIISKTKFGREKIQELLKK
ncbi:MAG: S-layer homology domain-containing protein [Candidatus Saganbacteria bacterium]|nr:S-layer homology domain-containing protein [Candidatus Saganbacteria bacterium]